MNYSKTMITVISLPVGGLGGFIAESIGLPMPWMLGSLIITGCFFSFGKSHLPINYKFPNKFRLIFIAIIGIMIGSQVNQELIKQSSNMVISLLAITVFVVIAHFTNYIIFRKLGKYDGPTAFFCGAPGGLMESITMGEEVGCDIKLLTVQQFLRIISVVIIVPTLMSIWVGEPLGSASGIKLPTSNSELPFFLNYFLVFVVAVTGLFFGIKLKLPAAHLMGPLIVAALISLLDVTPIHLPVLLVIISQVVIGVSLGTRFLDISSSVFYKGAWLSLISVFSMLSIGGLLCFLVTPFTETSLNALLISFAPGGVTEMSLIALSLSANPAVVTLHHLYRIIITVSGLTFIRRRFDFIDGKISRKT